MENFYYQSLEKLSKTPFLEITKRVLVIALILACGLAFSMYAAAQTNSVESITLTVNPRGIHENDGPRIVTIIATFPAGSAILTEDTMVALSVASTSTAISGTDYTLTSLPTITIHAGQTSGSADIFITPIDNNIVGTDKLVIFDGSTTGGVIIAADMVSEATLIIVDDDSIPSGITLTVSPTTITENGGAQTVTITATFAGVVDTFAEDTTVTPSVSGGTAISGTDYTLTSLPTITIPAGATSGNTQFSITPVDDNIAGGSATIIFHGFAFSGATILSGNAVTEATLLITDDDSDPIIVTSISMLTATARTEIMPVTITSSGGAVARYSIEPEIGNGLQFDTTTGKIFGTPKAEAELVNYTITAHNAVGTGAAQVSITVNPAPTITLSLLKDGQPLTSHRITFD